MDKKLRSNKNKIKRLGKASVFLVGGTYLLSVASYGISNINNTLQRDYYEVVYQTKSLYKSVATGDLENINYDFLSKIKSIRIDMFDADYFDNLVYFTNLDAIEICNAELLTDENIELLNCLPLKEISLFFDKNYVLNNIDKKFDLDRFIDKRCIKNIAFNNSLASDEIDSIIFFEYLDNYKNCSVDFIKYEPLNDALDEIIEDLDLTDEEDDYNNLVKISNYVINHVHYDENVLNYTEKHQYITPFSSVYWDLLKYNKKTLSTVVSNRDNADKSAVCSNYADFTLALSIKGNIKSDTLTGKYNLQDHSWNVVEIKDNDNVNYYYLDTTWCDSNDIIKDKINNYDIDSSELLIDINSDEGQSYKPNKEYDKFYDSHIFRSNMNNIYATRTNQIKVFGFNALYSILIYEGIEGLKLIKQLISNKLQMRKLKPNKEKKDKEKKKRK